MRTGVRSGRGQTRPADRTKRRRFAARAINFAFGAAAGTAPTLNSIEGCDEGGIVDFTAGAATGSGTIFTITFAKVYPFPPAVTFSAGNGNAADHPVLNDFRCYVESTTTGWSLKTDGAPDAAARYVLHWSARGWMP